MQTLALAIGFVVVGFIAGAALWPLVERWFFGPDGGI